MKLQNSLLVISTVIAATAPSRLPTDPELQPLPMLKQQYSKLQQKMCDDQDLACVQNHKIKSVGVDHLSAEQIVEVRYMAPN